MVQPLCYVLTSQLYATDCRRSVGLVLLWLKVLIHEAEEYALP